MGAMARHRMTITLPEEWLPAIRRRMTERGIMKMSEYMRQLIWSDIKRYKSTIYGEGGRHRRYSPLSTAILRVLLEKGPMEPYFIYKEVTQMPGLEDTKPAALYTALFRLRRRDGILAKERGRYRIADEEAARRIIENPSPGTGLRAAGGGLHHVSVTAPGAAGDRPGQEAGSPSSRPGARGGERG